jgi:hypothetical protein
MMVAVLLFYHQILFVEEELVVEEEDLPNLRLIQFL